MGKHLFFDAAIALTDGPAAPTALTPRMRLASSEAVVEHGTPTFLLDPDEVDVPVEIPGVEHGRLLLVDSDLVLQIKLDDEAATPVVARRLWIEAGTARRVYLTPLGRWVEEGTATAGSAGSLQDTAKQWSFARLVGSRVSPPITLSERTCRIRVGAHSALMTLNAPDLSGPELATMLEATIAASPVGPGRVTVAWDDEASGLVFEALVPGPQAISFESWLQDTDLLEVLGVLVPASRYPGGESLAGHLVDILAGTGAGQRRIVSANTGTALTVAPDFGVPPDATSVYRLTKPSPGSVTVLAAR